MSDLLESCIPQALYQEVLEVVLLEPLGTDDLLEAPTEHTLLQLGDDHTLLEPVETLVLLTECTPCIPRSGGVLPVGDTVVGAGFDPSALPLASDQTPQAFIVQQAGQWVLASYAQMAAWFAGAPAFEHGYGLLTEAGEFLLTESGGFITQELT